MVVVDVIRSAEAINVRAVSRGGVSNNRRIRRFLVRGHAGYAPHGEDIVCAAASAIIYTAAGALEILCGAQEEGAAEQEGYFEISIPLFEDNAATYKADIIMETAYIGFKQIENSYPDFIKVNEIINKINNND